MALIFKVGPEISRALARLEEIRTITDGLPEIDRLPPGRVMSLARFASAAKAQAVSRLPDDRRTATLLAFIRTLEASASDDVIDLFDVVTTSIFSNAQAVSKQARLRTLRDLDAAALKLRDGIAVLFDEATPDHMVRAVIFETVGRDGLKTAYEQVGALAEPPDDVYFAELRKHRGQFRFAPALLRGLNLDAAVAGKPLLDAVEHVRAVQTDANAPDPHLWPSLPGSGQAS